MNSGFNQFRVSEIRDIEVDTGPTEGDFIFRVFASSRVGEQIALEWNLEQIQTVSKAISSALSKFPGGSLAN